MTLHNDIRNPLRDAPPPGSSPAQPSFAPSRSIVGWTDAQSDCLADNREVRTVSACALPVPSRVSAQMTLQSQAGGLRENSIGSAAFSAGSALQRSSSVREAIQPQLNHLHHRSALPHRTPPASGSRHYGTSMGEGRSPTQRRYASSPLAGHGASRFSGRTPPQPLLTSFLGSPDASAPFRSAEHMRRLSGNGKARSPIGGASFNRRRFSEQSPGNTSGPLFGSLVGSYEESLLNGRMSTTPSKPLVFDAELGVLGLGKCRSSLKCPPHLNVKFPAHFYNLEGAAYMEGRVSPSSPYVGTIDLEGHYVDELLSEDLNETHHDDISKPTRWQMPAQEHDLQRRMNTDKGQQQKKKPAFPGYRVPPKGQIQLVIKNPNLTAVKVFLVPYDLTDMPAGKKTFVRQKCHIAPPRGSATVESPASDTSRDEICSTLSSPRSPSPRANLRIGQRETLRYAVHLQFCAIAPPQHRKGQVQVGFRGDDRLRRSPNLEPEDKPRKSSAEPRYYLHKAVRVVFTARVPDKSEKLTTVTETPQDANGDGIYSTFTGPSEQWTDAKHVLMERAMYDRILMQRSTTSRTGYVADAAFTDGMANSDPNGERWAQQTPEESDVPMDVEMEPFNTGVEEMGGTQSTLSYAPAAVPMTITRSQTRSRAGSADATDQQSSLHSFPTMSDDALLADQNRALLQQWYASLNSSRNVSGRPSSPALSRSRPTSPQLSRLQTSPTSQIGSIDSSFAAMQRSLSNLSSQDSDDSELTRSLKTKCSRLSVRTGSASRISGNGGNSVLPRSCAVLSHAITSATATAPISLSATLQGVPSPKLSVASVADEPVSGIMLPASIMQPQGSIERGAQSGAGLHAIAPPAHRPSLLRRLSSQASMRSDKAILHSTASQLRSSPFQTPSNASPSLPTAVNRLKWRQQPRSRAGSEESQ